MSVFEGRPHARMPAGVMLILTQSCCHFPTSYLPVRRVAQTGSALHSALWYSESGVDAMPVSLQSNHQFSVLCSLSLYLCM